MLEKSQKAGSLLAFWQQTHRTINMSLKHHALL